MVKCPTGQWLFRAVENPRRCLPLLTVRWCVGSFSGVFRVSDERRVLNSDLPLTAKRGNVPCPLCVPALGWFRAHLPCGKVRLSRSGLLPNAVEWGPAARPPGPFGLGRHGLTLVARVLAVQAFSCVVT